MRDEQTVLRQLIDAAGADARVRAVVMNGSRANRNAPMDMMRDYDVVFYVSDIADMSYKEDRSWIEHFGDLVMLQQNDFDDGCYIFLMQFMDGVRIDLCFDDIRRMNQSFQQDSLSKLLLDKDNVADVVPEPNESGYYVKRPSCKEWEETLNNLWWIQIYIAKEIWRDELPLAKYLYDVVFTDDIRKLISWQIGEKYNWQVNVGKSGKWFKRHLDDAAFLEYRSIYCGVEYADMWRGLARAGALIRKVGTELGFRLEYPYPVQNDINASEFIRRIQALPPNACSFQLIEDGGELSCFQIHRK